MGIFDWMIPEGERCPLSPFEVTKRAKNIPKILEWSRNKHLVVSGPEIFGTHHIFINDSLKHVIVLLKADKTTHVIMGTPTGAEEWRKYDREVKLELSEEMKEGTIDWKIYQDYVLYRGLGLPPKRNPEPYWGQVIKVEEFKDEINDDWISSEIMNLFKGSQE